MAVKHDITLNVRLTVIQASDEISIVRIVDAEVTRFWLSEGNGKSRSNSEISDKNEQVTRILELWNAAHTSAGKKIGKLAVMHMERAKLFKENFIFFSENF